MFHLQANAAGYSPPSADHELDIVFLGSLSISTKWICSVIYENKTMASLKRLEEIFDAKPGTPESDELEILGMIVDDYENKHYLIEAPDPIETIKIRMEEMDLKQIDLAELMT
ncbi:MAG: hypothetical protein ABFS10_07990 [Bacteroidota bacterium]